MATAGNRSFTFMQDCSVKIIRITHLTTEQFRPAADDVKFCSRIETDVAELVCPILRL